MFNLNAYIFTVTCGATVFLLLGFAMIKNNLFYLKFSKFITFCFLLLYLSIYSFMIPVYLILEGRLILMFLSLDLVVIWF